VDSGVYGSKQRDRHYDAGIVDERRILVKLRPISKNHDNNDNYYEVLVPEAEVEEAHSVIIEKDIELKLI